MLKAGLKFQVHQLGTKIALTMALTAAALHAPSAHSAEIEAIMGGGTVLGTECVNGLVVEDQLLAVCDRGALLELRSNGRAHGAAQATV